MVSSKKAKDVPWKQWKKSNMRVKNLISLGLPRDKAYEWGNSRKKILAHRM
jgi:hypothetical protein